MLILPVAFALGLLMGWARGGSLRALSDVQFRHSSFVLAAIATQAALELPGPRSWPTGVHFGIVVMTYLVVGWWLLENTRSRSAGMRCGLGLVASGWALNLLAIIPNGGMPVSESALGRAGIARSTSVIRGHLSKHVPAGHHTVLLFLGDVIPLSWFRSVISAGDIVMAVGIGIVVASAMTMPTQDNLPVDGSLSRPPASEVCPAPTQEQVAG